MFTEEEQPILNPEESAECELNRQQLINVWNYLRCLSAKSVYTGKLCYKFFDSESSQTIFNVPKADLTLEPATCDIRMYKITNLTQVVMEIHHFEFLTDVSTEYTLTTDDPTNWIFELSESVLTTETLIIEILVKESLLDLMECPAL